MTNSMYYLLISLALVGFLVFWLLRYRKRKLRMTSLRREFEQFPVALKSHFEQDSQNAPINIYNGEITLIFDDQEVHGTGTLKFLWLPNPRVVVEAEVGLSNPYDRQLTPMLQIRGYEPAQLIVTKLNLAGNQETTHYEGILSTTLWPIQFADGLQEVWFTLTNFHDYIGQAVRPNENRPSVRTRRWILYTDIHEITVDISEGFNTIIEETKTHGGYGKTHIGRIRNNEDTSTSRGDFERLNIALFYYFGFARGFWVGPVLPFVESGDDKHVVYGPYRTTAYQSAESWFPTNPTEFGNSFREFYRLLQNPDWEKGIQHTIDWYVDANTADTLESSIVKTQVALELLAWLILVDRRNAKTSRQFKGDSASKNISDLLNLLGISSDFPSHLVTLKNSTTSWGATTGVEAFVKVRNKIIHSTNNSRSQLSTLGTQGKLEAKQLGLQYIELCLLAAMSYDGTYSDRTILDGNKGHDQIVPWA